MRLVIADLPSQLPFPNANPSRVSTQSTRLSKEISRQKPGGIWDGKSSWDTVWIWHKCYTAIMKYAQDMYKAVSQNEAAVFNTGDVIVACCISVNSEELRSLHLPVETVFQGRCFGETRLSAD